MGDKTSSSPAVHSLDRVRMSVPDLDEAERFYGAFGLDTARHDGKLLLRTHGSDHVWVEITQGSGKKLLSLRLGIFEHDRSGFADRLADIRLASPADEAGSEALWCSAPDGLAIELAVVPKSSPDAKGAFGLPDRFTETRGASPRSRCATVKPRRLAHVGLFTSDVDAALEFYCGKLGLALSDRSGSDVAFLHGVFGSDHHMLAVARSEARGLHHSSWDVANIAEVGLGAMQMEAAGYGAGWGLGRHVLGSNYFHYVRDPWGSYAEYSADMDYIGADELWQAADHPAEDSFFQWGPPPPEGFTRNFEHS